MKAPLDLKSTLNLPKTSFAMKANLPQNEPKMLARWEQMRIYDRIRQSRRGAPLYVLHDGPPYANGPIHLGTALNKCLKDFVVKSKTMAGFDAPYIPGWDCHGLPIEIKVDEALGRKKLQMAPIEVRQACRKYAEKYLDLQRAQFKRIGVFGRFDEPYSTMTPQYEAVVLQTLFTFFDKGAVYKGLRPVYWCIHDKTALAEAEVEYENHTSPSIWVRFPLAQENARLGSDVHALAWTTTPWSLPGTFALAFHPDYEYVVVESDAGALLLAAERLAAVAAETGINPEHVRSVGKGKDLEGLEFHHPFAGFRVPAVLADYVTLDRGTGVVTTAPGHGTEDFYTGQKYGLRVYAPLDDTGTFVEGLPEYRGKTVFEANPAIIALLRERGALLAEGKLSHSYPHCWRCHNPVVFRATEQWFIAMEADLGGGATLRQRALDEIAKVKWDPAWGEERISNMVATRPDWCISRQRVWGVPIAVFFCEPCKELLRSGEVDRAVVDLVAREGVDAWYTREAASILPPGTKCARCGGTHFRKEMDIIDVWFESGSSYLTLHQAEKDLPWPSDLYLEGGDQYRGWFHSSLLCAVGAKNQSPYKMVATNGWTLDPQGRAMSKSVGNVVDPVDIANRLGGEIVRLWVASVDFREDVRASEDLMQRIADQYRKIRNTFRFALQNLYDFDPRQDVVEFAAMQSFDQFMLLETARLADEVAHWHEEFQFHKVYQRLLKFCVVDLSALYFDVLKDRLYTHAPNSRGRRSAQTAVWRIAETLVRLFAPMMSFTVDEIWHYLPTLQGRPESVHLARFASRKEILADAVGDLDGLRAEWETLLAVREEVMRALEIARSSKLIGSGLEAKLCVLAPEAIYPVLAKHADELRYLFIVSAVELERGASGNGASGIRVDVTKAPGQKCERCWNYSTRVGENRTYPTICERCAAALKEMESSR